MVHLSFDVEGTYRKDVLPETAREEELVQKLLALLIRYDMVATWAVVGKLFEENTKLVRMLRASGHEIASHSYSHKDFAELSEDQARKELQTSTRAGAQSFVFPYNHVRYTHLLSQYGFRTYRKGGMYFPSRRKLGMFIPAGWRFFAAKQGIDYAVRTGKVFHLWTHPIDLIDTDLFIEFSWIIMYVSGLKKQGRLV